MFLTMVLYYYDLLFGLYPSSLCFATTTFRGIALPSSPGELTLLGPAIELVSIGGVGTPDDEGGTIPRNVVVAKHKDDE
jgi:hypothetical protein